MPTVTLHPSIVHFPIALLLLGSASALLYMYGPRRAELVTFSWWLLLLGWIGSLAAILSGLLAQSGLPPRAPYRATLNWHIGTGMAIAVVYATLLYIRWLRRPRDGVRADAPQLLDDDGARLWLTILLLIGMLLVAASGWNGGRLVYEFGVNVG